MTRLYLDLFLTTIGRSKTKNFFSVQASRCGQKVLLVHIFTRIFFSSSSSFVCVFRFDPLSFRFKKVSKFHPSISIHTTHYPAKYPLGLNLLSLTLLNISEKEKKKRLCCCCLYPFFFVEKENKKEEEIIYVVDLCIHTHTFICMYPAAGVQRKKMMELKKCLLKKKKESWNNNRWLLQSQLLLCDKLFTDGALCLRRVCRPRSCVVILFFIFV